MVVSGQILTSGRPRSDILAIRLKWQVRMGSLGKVALLMSIYFLPLEASILEKPKMLFLGPNLDFRDIPGVILA